MPVLTVLSHHSEPSDPVLLRWTIETFESLLGLGPVLVIVPALVTIIALPLALVVLAVRRRQSL